MSTIVVGHDGSDTSNGAVLEAARLAEALDATLHIVTAYRRDGAVSAGEGSMFGGISAAEEVLREAATRYGGRIEVTHSASSDDPADALVNAATEHEASMIVVGNRRTQGLSRVLGSVASAVVKRAPCSVHIAHTTS